MPLSNEEIRRYSRHLNLPRFGLETQEKLKESSVLVVGSGGLGAPLLQYLTAAGVGTIGLVDFDVIDETNLQRQVLFDSSDIGKPKTEVAIQKLKAQNPNIKFKEYNTELNSDNALDIIQGFDVVADGTDNFPTRYLVNDACVLSGKPNIYASIFQFEGQVSVFNYQDKSGSYGPNYRDLFPTPPPPGMVPSCAEGGVLGVLPGIIGSIQASETIKVLTGLGTPLSGRLYLFDALEFTSRTINIRKDPSNPLTGDNPTQTGLIDYEEFCGMNDKPEMKSISVAELKKWKEGKRDFNLIDVREDYERKAAHIGGDFIPLGEIEEHVEKISADKETVVYCKGGVRSANAIALLNSKYGYKNLINLEGGIMAWKMEIEPDLEVL